ncbi:MAG TPA: sulfurtransferase [Methylomirabilota bacterium]|jgi:thiosulfate/3-mercaptopyruvate sulfurtransferase|nr:sulfurtransferase [Methylomirabilota bacterium]
MTTAGLLVPTEWLQAHLGDPTLRVFDCTTRLVPDPATTFRAETARPDWESGHVPGSGYLDLIEELSERASPYRFTVPSAEQFARVMSAHGVGPGARVVLYSATSNYWATRVWWLLRAFGFDDAAVLDGGWEKWTREGRPTSKEPSRYPAASFVARPRPELLARTTDVAAAMADPAVCTINALTYRQHTGEGGVHYGRPGHIPGSVSVPYLDLIDRETNTFLPEPALRARLESAGALTAPRVVTYCGGGIAATGVAFALALLGRGDVAVYDGSLGEWCADPSRPMERG